MNNLTQNKKIKLNNKEISYTLKTSSRARNMRLAVYCGGSFIVTRPWGFSENAVERFIIKKTNWVMSKIEYFKNFPVKRFLGGSKSDYLKRREEALRFAEERIAYFNNAYNLKFNKINIRNQKTRWGSCSKKRNINFNYKIIMLPRELADYIIVHELCHLKVFNHSRKFWQLVARAMPNYLEIRKKLRQKGLELT